MIKKFNNFLNEGTTDNKTYTKKEVLDIVEKVAKEFGATLNHNKLQGILSKLNESVQDEYYTLGGYDFWGSKSYDYKREEKIDYYIIDGDYDGKLIIEDSPRGRGESFAQLEGIEWDGETPEYWEDIEEFVGKNLYKIMENTPVI